MRWVINIDTMIMTGDSTGEVIASGTYITSKQQAFLKWSDSSSTHENQFKLVKQHTIANSNRNPEDDTQSN